MPQVGRSVSGAGLICNNLGNGVGGAQALRFQTEERGTVGKKVGRTVCKIPCGGEMALGRAKAEAVGTASASMGGCP